MYKLDARGRVCPLPLFYTKKKIDGLKTGEELEVLIDDVTAKDTIPRWSREHGHEIVMVEESGNDLRNYRKITYLNYSPLGKIE